MPSFKENYSFKETNKKCFTYSNKIVYVPYEQKSTIIMIGLPVLPKCFFKFKACLQILQMILFQKLRVELKMVYGINIQLETLNKVK